MSVDLCARCDRFHFRMPGSRHLYPIFAYSARRERPGKPGAFLDLEPGAGRSVLIAIEKMKRDPGAFVVRGVCSGSMRRAIGEEDHAPCRDLYGDLRAFVGIAADMV